MKVLEIPSYGVENLQYRQRDEPVLGPGEVRLKMRAASLNYRDLLTVNGVYGRAYALPLVPLSDGCGDVVAIGADVRHVKVGDRVASLFFSNWVGGQPRREFLQTSRGGPLDGCWREEMNVPETGVSPAPSHLSDLEVATLPCAALTAWRALIVEGNIKAGDTVVVQGTGGVSLFALQFAKAHGAEIIATSSSDEKLARAKAMGADHLINYKSMPEWSKRVREVTNGRGADHVVEVGGGGTLAESLKCVAIGGRIAVIGALSGAAKDLFLPIIIGANVRIQGISVGNRQHFEDMSRAMTLHRIKPVIDRVFGFADAKSAFAHMASQAHFGKIAIDLQA